MKFVLALLLLACANTANAQGTHEFLGRAREVPDQFSPRYGIRYNTQGYDQPQVNWSKKVKKWQKKDVPDWAIDQMISFPGNPDAIGNWIDSAFEQVQKQFMQCGGSLADRASRVSPGDIKIRIMPSAFFEPYHKVYVAGAFYPDTREIKVLNIYYIWDGANRGWLRHAKDLLVWEMGNYFGVQSNVQPEPRSQSWPCSAPALK
jgi:hypothetical protein